MIQLSVIIVNYKSADLIINCLQSFFDHTTLDCEIIVIDNASNDDSEQKILGRFSFVKWIQMGYNAGFARANNAGIKASNAQVVLLLNPDIIVIDSSINDCYTRFINSDMVAAGVQLQNEDGSPQISGNFFIKGGINHLLPLPYWGNLLRWIGYRSKVKPTNVQQASTLEKVDWISGAYMMVKKNVIDKAGMMDDDFFLYAEEIEWCYRLGKFGELCIFGDLYIVHLQGETINNDQKSTEKGYYGLFDRKGLQLIVSNHLRVRKQFGITWFLFLLCNYTWAVLVFALIGFFENLFKLKNPVNHLPKVVAFGKNVWQLWKLSPKILANRPYFYKVL